MSNNNVPGSNQNVNVQVRALTIDQEVTSQYKTKILHKNLVNGVNTLTREMMSAQNTKYVIKYDYVLGDNITVPANCILEFDGGSISASGNNNTIIGNNTCINSANLTLFKNVLFEGSFRGNILDITCDTFEGSLKLAYLSDGLELTKDWILAGNYELNIPSINGNNHIINSGNNRFTCTKNNVVVKDITFISSLENNAQRTEVNANLIHFSNSENITITNVTCKKESNDATTRVMSFLRFDDSSGITIDNIMCFDCATCIAIVDSGDKKTSDILINNVYAINFETCVWIKDVENVQVSNISGINTPEQRQWYIGQNAGTNYNGKDLLLIGATNAVVSNLYCKGAIERCIYANRIFHCSFTNITFEDCDGVKFVGTASDGTIPEEPTFADINSDDIVVNNVHGVITDKLYGLNPNPSLLTIYMIKNIRLSNMTYILNSISLNQDSVIEITRAVQNILIENVEISSYNSNYFVSRLIHETCTALENVKIVNLKSYNTFEFSRSTYLFDNNNIFDLDNIRIYGDTPRLHPRRVAKTPVNISNSYIELCPPPASFDDNSIGLLSNSHLVLFSHATSKSYTDAVIKFLSSWNTLIHNVSVEFRNSPYYEGLKIDIEDVTENFAVTGVKGMYGKVNAGTENIKIPLVSDTYGYINFDLEINRTRGLARYTKQKNFTYITYIPALIQITQLQLVHDEVTSTINIFELVDTKIAYIKADKLIANTDSMPNKVGTSTQRPAFDSGNISSLGFVYFDTTLGKPIYWTGDTTKGDNGWIDANGNNPTTTIYPKVIGNPTTGNLAKFNNKDIEDAGVAPTSQS